MASGPAGSEQQLAHGQAGARAHRALSLDDIGVEDEHFQQPIVRATVRPPGSRHKNIGREGRFSISSRSMASGFGFTPS